MLATHHLIRHNNVGNCIIVMLQHLRCTVERVTCGLLDKLLLFEAAAITTAKHRSQKCHQDYLTTSPMLFC